MDHRSSRDPIELRDGAICYSHPLNAPGGQNIYGAVRKAVMSSSNVNVMWKSIAGHGSESSVGIGQVYSDKSAVTLKARGFQFYPVHLVLLNLSEGKRRRMITSGASIVGYLPVSFEVGEQCKGIIVKTLRKHILLSIHQAIKSIFEPLSISAKERIACVDQEGNARTCHLAIGAYCSDMPEAEDMTGVQHGSFSASTCVRCLARTEDMNMVTNARKRDLQDIGQLISDSKRMREEADVAPTSVSKKMRDDANGLLKESSSPGIYPSLSSFPFMALCQELDPFRDICMKHCMVYILAFPNSSNWPVQSVLMPLTYTQLEC